MRRAFAVHQSKSRTPRGKLCKLWGEKRRRARASAAWLKAERTCRYKLNVNAKWISHVCLNACQRIVTIVGLTKEHIKPTTNTVAEF